MLYAVSARLIPDRAGEFFTRLTDGSIAAQRPDGQEIVAAMGRACLGSDGTVRWTETCFCPTPLEHERETVLDRYFTDIETDLLDAPAAVHGEPLMDQLRLAARTRPRALWAGDHPTPPPPTPPPPNQSHAFLPTTFSLPHPPSPPTCAWADKIPDTGP